MSLKLQLASHSESSQAKRWGTDIDLSRIQVGIQAGGKVLTHGSQSSHVRSCTTERIIFHPITIPHFSELCQKETPPLLSEPQKAFHGVISYNSDLNSNSFLGKGAFKTAISADVTLFGPRRPRMGLGQDLGAGNEATLSVALKRPFESKRLGSGIKRLGVVDEERKIMVEANMLRYASSLLNFAYAHINQFIADHDPPQAPFTIPELRFVNGAVAFAQKEVDVMGAPNSHRAVYLLEELLKLRDKSTFEKYIHNANATPLQEVDEPGYETAIFLCFIQHMQFVKTHYQAYVSDFQGIEGLLTDPQIMTNPALGVDLFGEGNVEKAFYDFPDQHVCNKYCQWFQLDKLEPSTSGLYMKNISNQKIIEELEK
jgi:hypothetical protein